MLLLLLLLYQLIYSSAQLPELVLLTVLNIRDYFYTNFDSPRPLNVTFASRWPNMHVLIKPHKINTTIIDSSMFSYQCVSTST